MKGFKDKVTTLATRSLAAFALALASNSASAETRPVLGAERWVCEFTKTGENWGGTFDNVIVHKKVFLDYNPFVDRDTPVWKRTRMPFGPRCMLSESRRGQIFDKRGNNWYYKGSNVVAYSMGEPTGTIPQTSQRAPVANPNLVRPLWESPISAAGGYDTYVRSSLPASTWTTEKNLIVGGWGDYYFSIIRFDPKNIPSNLKSNRVFIRVFVYQPSDGTKFRPTPLSVYRVIEPFPPKVNWNSRPVMDASKKIKMNVLQEGWLDIDVTEYVRSWSQGSSNFGIVIVPDRNDNKFTILVSSDDVERRQYAPKIVVGAN